MADPRIAVANLSSQHGHQVQTMPDKAAEHVQTAMKTHDQLKNDKNASYARWLCGWPIEGTQYDAQGAATQTSIATALDPLTEGNVDIFTRAISDLPKGLGSFNIGQAPWNNFLGNNTRPFKDMYPEAGGIYMGSVWDMVTGDASAMTTFRSQMVENTLVTLLKNTQPESYIPWLTFPPGIRFDERVTSSIANETLTTQGFGEMSAHGLRPFRSDEYWNPKLQLAMQLQPTKPLSTYIATLTSQMVPAAGSLIAWVGYGYELRQIGTQV